MDSWYFMKSLYLAIEKLDYNRVTRAKSNTTLYRKVVIRGKERIIAILPAALYKEAKPVFSFWKKKGIICMKFKDIYLLEDEVHKGLRYLKERIFKPINAVVTAYQEEDKNRKIQADHHTTSKQFTQRENVGTNRKNSYK